MAAESSLILRGAHVAPPLEADHPLHGPMGVFDSAGAFCPAANIRRHTRVEMPELPMGLPPAERLAGQHLFGGILYHHFGHFICESLSRLWALQPGHGVESVIFILRRAGQPTHLLAHEQAMLDLFDFRVPVRVLAEPVTVEQLVIPPQGFGIGPLCEGTPAFRAFVRARLAPHIAPEGPPDLFISRANLPLRKGGMLGEDTLALHLQAEGYEVFAPEKHPIAVQIARYRAARRIIAVEGSALHLYALVGQERQQLALIDRRSDGIDAGSIGRQVAAFCGHVPARIDAILQEWDHARGPERSARSIAEVDMPELGRALRALGMITGGNWPPIRSRAQQRVDRIAQKFGRQMIAYPRKRS